MNKLWTFLGIAVGLAVLSVGGFFLIKNIPSNQTVIPNEQTAEAHSPTPAPSGIFSEIAHQWTPSATWSKPKMIKEETPLGNYVGYKSSTILTSDVANVSSFEDKNYLSSLGFKEDNMFSASGPASNMWGYRNPTSGEAVIFSYKTQPTSSKSNEPLQFTCPCKIDLNVFIGLPVGS